VVDTVYKHSRRGGKNLIQFFQSRMGDKFFNSTMVRLVTALETIANTYSKSKELEDRVAVLELLLHMPYGPGRLECVDGFSLTVGTYDQDEYGHMYYLSFPSGKEGLLEPYRDNPDSPEAVSYSSVPNYVLARVIIKHGGLVDA